MKTLISLILLSLSALTFAQEGALIESVSFRGTGCEQEEAMAVMSPDQATLSLLFDNFVVEAGGESNIQRDQKNCRIQMKVSVPEDTRVVIEKIDFRGYAMLPSVASMRLSSSYFIAIPELGYKSQTFRKNETMVGEIEDELYLEQRIKNRILKSKCGRDFSLNIRAGILASTNSNNDEVYVALDSADTGIDYHISYETCEQEFRRLPHEDLERRNLRRQLRRENRANNQMREQRRIRRQRDGNPTRTRRCRDGSQRRNGRCDTDITNPGTRPDPGTRPPRRCTSRRCRDRNREANVRNDHRDSRPVPNRTTNGRSSRSRRSIP